MNATKVNKYVATAGDLGTVDATKVNKYVAMNLLAAATPVRRRVQVSVRIGEP